MNTGLKAPLMRSLGTLALALTLSTGCGHVSERQKARLTEQYKTSIILACPTSDPLVQYAALNRVFTAAEQHQDRARAWAELLDTGPGLTDAQREGYGQLVNAARDRVNADYAQLKRADQQRRAAAMQNAGRIMMEIQRTDDLDRIRRDQREQLQRGY